MAAQTPEEKLKKEQEAEEKRLAKEQEKKGADDTNEVLKKLMEQMAELQEQNKMLMEVADLGRVEKYKSKNSNQDVVHNARLRFINGRAVTAWKLIRDDVYKDSQGVRHESQIVELFFADSAESVTMDFWDSERLAVKEEGEIISRKKDNRGNETVVLRMVGGKEYEVDVKFIN